MPTRLIDQLQTGGGQFPISRIRLFIKTLYIS
jgi:hypothetical protein